MTPNYTLKKIAKITARKDRDNSKKWAQSGG